MEIADKSAQHAADSRRVLHVAGVLAASAGACTAKSLTPSLLESHLHHLSPFG